MKSIPAKNIWKKAAPCLLAAFFLLISAISLTSITYLQGNARVINYAGIIRGATQRLVKQELHQIPNDALIAYLDGVISELSHGGEEYGLTVLPDPKFQGLMSEMGVKWNEIKAEIQNVRQGAEGQRLFEMSEAYFELANTTVSVAEIYTENGVSRAIIRLSLLNGVFIVLVICFWIYNRRQKQIYIALQAAENASREKSAFLSRMSHEIRTPMNGIIGMTAIARMSLDQRDKLTDCLDKIDISSNYLLALLNDILDMSRIESGKMELCEEEFNLLRLIERVQVMFNPKAEAAGVQFTAKADGLSFLSVMGDELRINQVIVNIISNALKFTPSGGRVELCMRQPAYTDKEVTLEISVTDTGIGMSEEFQKRIFKPFEQAQANTARQYGGTGLGLAISYNFVKMMGGEIIVESKLNKGSRFTVRLPLRHPGTEAAQTDPASLSAKPGQEIDLSGAIILLAEDNAINGEIARALLESTGAAVEQAWDGTEAVEKFSVSPPGWYRVILMDIQMPGMDGLEASRNIRAMDRPDAHTIPIIGLSANAFRHDIDQALKSGMNGYLSKPIEIGKLFETLCTFT